MARMGEWAKLRGLQDVKNTNTKLKGKKCPNCQMPWRGMREDHKAEHLNRCHG